MKRINWIDWAKAIAITMVVFGHLPMEENNYLLRYITVFHMPLFFFISGNLSKTNQPTKKQFSKYFTSLVYPYIIYNIVFYPYWLARYYIKNDFHLGTTYDWLIKPFWGAMLLQHESHFSCVLNGVTWFIAALLIMKIVLSIVSRTNSNSILVIISILCIIGYVSNEQILFTKDLTPIGFMKCFPFFILGYKLKNSPILCTINTKRDFTMSVIGVIISNIAFILSRENSNYIINSCLFYIICVSGIMLILSICRLLDNFYSNIIITISNGTLMIMGLHWMIMGIINYSLCYVFAIDNSLLAFTTIQGILICFVIEFIIYFFIKWSIKYTPILIGKSQT